MTLRFIFRGKTKESLEKVSLTVQVFRKGTAVARGRAYNSAWILPYLPYGKRTTICKGKDNFKPVKLI